MKKGWVAGLLLVLLLGGCRMGPSEKVPRIREGLIQTEDTLCLGLSRRADTRWITVFQSDGYVNNAILTHFKGRYYCMWQQSEKDEDTPDTGVYYSVSDDGLSWCTPDLLVGPSETFFASPGGWIQQGDSLTALINCIYADDRSKGGCAFYTTTTDGLAWSSLQPVRMADGTPVQGIFEQDPLILPGGRIVGAVHFQPGTTLCPVYTDDPPGIRGWKKAVFPEGEGRPLEPSQYSAPDGNLVLFWLPTASWSCLCGTSNPLSASCFLYRPIKEKAGVLRS